MIKNSFCKINLNLSVISRCADGFHNIESVIYPVAGLADTIRMEPAAQFSFSSCGIELDCPEEDNLCVKAYRLMQERYKIGPVKLSLTKRIPFGAGLGAGSANAVAVVEAADELFALNLTRQAKLDAARVLGSDTSFFVDFVPQIASGRGEILSPIAVDLSGYYLYMVKPDIGVSTRRAYSLITPHEPQISVQEAIEHPIHEWKYVCVNDFQAPIFGRIPLLGSIRDQLYSAGAIYAAMSGSGSTVYGIFQDQPKLVFPYFSYCKKL
ncbi:MAG: 4-(cytidine 5'-diphospho)-2-C-methyl-D-erythritol kinase [Mucinivorans sp.]